MVKIYVKKYKKMMDSGKITLEEALKRVDAEVPERWRKAVREELERS